MIKLFLTRIIADTIPSTNRRSQWPELFESSIPRTSCHHFIWRL